MNQTAAPIVFITAAGQGIGRAAALAFARQGATVWATDINDALLAELASADAGAGKLVCRRLDVLDGDAVRGVIAEAGPVQVLFNCAGIVHHGDVLQASEADWELGFDLNVRAMVRTIQAVLPGMLERENGSIINMASVASSVKGVAARCVYGATKAAVIGLTKSVAADYVARGIRCNAICPGTVESPSLQARLRAQGDYETTRAAFIARQPIGRIGTADEIADLAVYLAGATYTTGQIHVIDGGWAI